MPTTPTRNFADLATGVLAGRPVTREEASDVLAAPDVELLAVLDAAWRIRHHHFGNEVMMNYLVNAKSGICPEDCHYCSQSKVSTAGIDRYPRLSGEEILHRVERGVELGAGTCCIVMSGRGPGEKDIQRVADAARAVKERHPDLRLCACLGLLDPAQGEILRAAGVDRYNHNVNTSESRYAEICSTHTYFERMETIRASKQAGLSPCSGVIAGMGETDEDLIDAAFALRDIGADSIPVNFLVSIDGTPLGGHDPEISPRRGLKILAMFRLVCPDREIRVSAGREVHLRTLQPLALYPANSLFVADYLTTPGQEPDLDRRMVEDLGFTLARPR
jgi:biotin synthase